LIKASPWPHAEGKIINSPKPPFTKRGLHIPPFRKECQGLFHKWPPPTPKRPGKPGPAAPTPGDFLSGQLFMAGSGQGGAYRPYSKPSRNLVVPLVPNKVRDYLFLHENSRGRGKKPVCCHPSRQSFGLFPRVGLEGITRHISPVKGLGLRLTILRSGAKSDSRKIPVGGNRAAG
jgi:hypothetical protein